MTLEGFLRDRQASWSELDELLGRARGRGRARRERPDDVLRLGRLYRSAAADLAVARRRFPNDPVRERLEQLVARAGLAVYRPRVERVSLWQFLRRDYWVRVAERPALLALAWVLILAPGVLAAFWASAHPDSALQFIPNEFRAATDPPTDAGTSAAQEAVFSSELFTHNISVTFLGYAAGLAAGIGTGVVLLFNGLLLGAVTGLAIEAGNGSAFLSFVVPHGPLELSCIVVTAAAGIRVGWSLVDPGPLPRGAALVAEARRSVGVVLGTMPWLVVAGIAEAFVRGSGLPQGVLIAIGVSLFATYWSLVLVRGRVGEQLTRAPATWP